jgi:bidirectional [NiFe] hydrogenase diaphorase subunit
MPGGGILVTTRTATVREPRNRAPAALTYKAGGVHPGRPSQAFVRPDNETRAGLVCASTLCRMQKETCMSSTVAAPSKTAPAGGAKGQPSGDNRYKMLEATMKRHQYAADSLIEVLHTAQELFGFLEVDLLLHIAHSLRVPPSRVYGVATFYHFFSLKPKGDHTVVICMGTACYVKGAAQVVSAIEALGGIKAGETTPDGRLSLMTARCIGACGIAPAVVLDGNITGKQTPAAVVDHVKGWLGNGS